MLAYAGGITLCVIAWGYLVYMAIDFGGSARTGNAAAWLLLVLAALGAAACLFIGLMLIARLGNAMGLSGPSSPPQDDSSPDQPSTRPAGGGRRAAR